MILPVPNKAEQDPSEELVLTAKEQLYIKRIKERLGGDIVRLEINDVNIKSFIDQACEAYAPYSVDYRHITKQYIHTVSLKDDGVEEVLRVMPAVQISTYDEMGDEYVFDFTMWSAADRLDKRNITNIMRRKITPDIDIPFEFDANEKVLMLRPGMYTGSITIECVPEQWVLDDFVEQKGQKWIFQYALALAKETIGQIRSKVTSSNFPYQLNGQQILDEGIAERKELEEALISQQAGPVALLR